MLGVVWAKEQMQSGLYGTGGEGARQGASLPDPAAQMHMRCTRVKGQSR